MAAPFWKPLVQTFDAEVMNNPMTRLVVILTLLQFGMVFFSMGAAARIMKQVDEMSLSEPPRGAMFWTDFGIVVAAAPLAWSITAIVVEKRQNKVANALILTVGGFIFAALLMESMRILAWLLSVSFATQTMTG